MADITNQLQATAGSAGGAKPQWLVSADTTNDRLVVYEWDSGSGFGSLISTANSSLSSEAWGCAISPDATVIAGCSDSSPYIHTWPFTSGTIGTKFSNPSTLPTGTCYGMAWNPNQTVLGVAGAESNGSMAWAWSGSGFGTKYANPATSDNSWRSVVFHPNNDVIFFCRDGGFFGAALHAYQWSDSTGFGTKYSDPGSAISSGGQPKVAVSPSGSSVAHTSDSGFGSPYIRVYPWAYSTGFGSAFSNPSTVPPGSCNGLCFSHAGDYVAVLSNSSPYIIVYPWSDSTGFGTKYSDPATLPASGSGGVTFSIDDDAIIMSGSNAIEAYAWSSSGFGSKYSNASSTDSFRQLFLAQEQ
jgi:hypothetical protein